MAEYNEDTEHNIKLQKTLFNNLCVLLQTISW